MCVCVCLRGWACLCVTVFVSVNAKLETPYGACLHQARNTHINTHSRFGWKTLICVCVAHKNPVLIKFPHAYTCPAPKDNPTLVSPNSCQAPTAVGSSCWAGFLAFAQWILHVFFVGLSAYALCPLPPGQDPHSPTLSLTHMGKHFGFLFVCQRKRGSLLALLHLQGEDEVNNINIKLTFICFCQRFPMPHLRTCFPSVANKYIYIHYATYVRV